MFIFSCYQDNFQIYFESKIFENYNNQWEYIGRHILEIIIEYYVNSNDNKLINLQSKKCFPFNSIFQVFNVVLLLLLL